MLLDGALPRHPLKRTEVTMKAWNTPVVREICVGAEINSYATGF